jgi:primosomal protein N' (replication factor Y)
LPKEGFSFIIMAMSEYPEYVTVAVEVAAGGSYTYGVPPTAAGLLSPGDRVMVNFGKQGEVPGIVLGRVEKPSFAEIKEVLRPVDYLSMFTPHLLELANWVAEYYLSPIGEVFNAMLPGGLKLKCHDLVILTGQAVSQRAGWESLDESQVTILKFLQAKGLATVEELALLPELNHWSVRQTLRALVGAGLVGIIPFITNPEEVYRQTLLAPVDREQAENYLSKEGKRAKNRARALNILLSSLFPVSFKEVEEATTRETVKSLLKLGLAYISLQPEEKPQTYIPPPPLTPTEEQAVALRQIDELLSAGKHATMLIYGVTGSGKTYLYIRAVEKVLAQGKTAIILVPEISLTPQTVERFRQALGPTVAVLHSNMTPASRFSVWRSARLGKLTAVVGPRSAVFAPLENVGLIVVDEEHDSSYKQSEPNPRYHGRDTAIKRAAIATPPAPVILGSATPSLESYYNATTGKYALAVLSTRVEALSLPEVEVVDMRWAEHYGTSRFFSAELVNAILQNQSAGHQTILLQNRRGYATVAICKECGHTLRCPRCDVTLTYHQTTNRLECHYCYYNRGLPKKCPECNQGELELYGLGTEQVLEELANILAGVGLVRMDADATRKAGSHEEILSAFGKGEYKVLVGTQMVAKGLDYPNVGLVGVISADTALALPDFRAGERTFQLLTQVCGRSGRGEAGGRAIIQTYQPKHYAVALAAEQNYPRFYEQEIAFRKRLLYPPFSRIAVVMVEDRRKGVAKEQSAKLRHQLETAKQEKGLSEVRILGPAPAAISRMRGYYRWQIILSAPKASVLQEMLSAIRHLPWGRKGRFARIYVDVDPVDLL